MIIIKKNNFQSQNETNVQAMPGITVGENIASGYYAN